MEENNGRTTDNQQNEISEEEPNTSYGKTISKKGYVRPKTYKTKYKTKFAKYEEQYQDTCTTNMNTENPLKRTRYDVTEHHDGPNEHIYATDSESAVNDEQIHHVIDIEESHNENEMNAYEVHEQQDNQYEAGIEDNEVIGAAKESESENHDDWDKNSLVNELLSELRNENLEWEDYVDHDNIEADNDFDDEMVQEEPIQPGHTLSTSTSIVLIWMFIISHSLTASQVSDLLALINIHLLVANPALKSLHNFRKYFSKMKTPITKHYFCNYCFYSVQSDSKVCPNRACQKDLTRKKSKDFFIEHNIENQLENLFSQESFRQNISYPANRLKKNKSNIEDIYDGLLYKSLVEDGQLGPHNDMINLSFTLNTDGVPIFKSSKTSIWPIFLMINELPFRLRKQRENMLLCGLWFGQEKPSMNMFFNPLQESMKKLNDGIEINIGDDKSIFVRSVLLCLSCDIPARSAVLNMNQHNGECACPKCLQKGVNTRTPAGGNIRTFPFNTENPFGPPRSSAQVKSDGLEAKQKKQTINGQKGVSFLMFTPKFDMVKGVAIDYMHMLCLGIGRLLLKFWFSSEFSTQEFSLYSFIDLVDSRIQGIKPSHFITRSPRTISDHLKFWKAAEVRSWFFYYSVPCIFDLLKPVYFYHYCALLQAMYLLCQSSISEADLELSQRLLNYYVFMFSSLYDDRYVTLNIHSLLHLPQTVREIGPLWCHSCFAFEGANGDLLKMFHGTMYIDIQIVNAVHVFQMVPLLAQKVESNSLIHSLVKSLTNNHKNYDSSIYKLCGKPYSKQLSELMITEISAFIHEAIYTLSCYNRAIIRGIVYHSTDYTRVSMRNSYTVKYLDRSNKIKFGFVMFFATHTSTDNEQVDFVCISKLNLVNVNIFSIHHEWENTDIRIKSNFLDIKLPFIHIVNTTDFVDIIPLKNILDLCICIDGEKFKIICEEPNHHELNL